MAGRPVRPLAVLLLLAALALAGCSAKTGGGGATQVSIHDFKFDPATVTVKAGSTVTFTNHDSATHTATADAGAFDTGSLTSGQSKSVTLDKAGTYTYHCDFHSSMKATIVVE